jgi:hypothetical protein
MSRDPVRAGNGNGAIGAGESRIAEELRKRIAETEKKARLMAPRRAMQTPVPVRLVDVPDAHVTLVETEGIDPVVRDHLALQVRERHNSVRYCYESWGLAADATRAGRLVLEMTLNPDGHISDVRASVSNPALALVAECVEKMASQWYLGDQLVEEPRRLSFPFILQPRDDFKVEYR